MGQGVTHMTVINATPVQATVSAHVHGVQSNTHEQHTETIHPQQAQVISLTRQNAGEYKVDWAINFSNGTHAEWNENISPGAVSKTMLLGNDRVTIDGKQVARVKKGASARHPHHEKGARFPAPVDVPASALPSGSVIHLKSFKTNKNVQILQDGTIRALGGKGAFTRFVVDPTPKGHLRLRSEKFPQHFIALKGVAGQGNSACHLRAQMIAPNRYVLRSIDGSKGIGFQADGSIKPSSEVGTGEGASFSIVFADVQPMSQIHPLLRPNNVVRLKCKKTGKYARIKDSAMDGNGGQGPLTRFRINPSEDGHLRFESVHTPGQFLSHKGSVGQGGPHTEFVAHVASSPDELHFRSLDDTKALGFKEDGSIKPAENVARGPAGTFIIESA